MGATLPTTKSAAFLRAISFILPHETVYARGHWGDLSQAITENVSGDAGGLTKYGIDQRSHPNVDISRLTLEGATNLYWYEWLDHRLDLLPERLAIAAFDVYVNGGYPIRWLQHAFNETHDGVKALVEDNQLGPKTLAALTSANQDALLRLFLRERDARFRALAAKPALAKFLNGWLQRDVDLAAFLNVYMPPTTR